MEGAEALRRNHRPTPRLLVLAERENRDPGIQARAVDRPRRGEGTDRGAPVLETDRRLEARERFPVRLPPPGRPEPGTHRHGARIRRSVAFFDWLIK